jgi:hypothetical protein
VGLEALGLGRGSENHGPLWGAREEDHQ